MGFSGKSGEVSGQERRKCMEKGFKPSGSLHGLEFNLKLNAT